MMKRSAFVLRGYLPQQPRPFRTTHKALETESEAFICGFQSSFSGMYMYVIPKGYMYQASGIFSTHGSVSLYNGSRYARSAQVM